jgi:hypothetical protein
MGRCHLVVCVDCNIEPSGSNMEMPGLAGCLWPYDAVLVRK